MAGKKYTYQRITEYKYIVLADWRINADERAKYDVYFQQCNPVQGYLTGLIINYNRNIYLKNFSF